MTDEISWPRVEEVFDRAIDLSGDARRAYLDEACSGHPQLRAEVEGLLRAADEPSALLDLPAGERFATEFAGALESIGHVAERHWFGRRVGAYEIVDSLGHGGMGRVFRGRRADGAFEEDVAVKILRWEVATEEAIRRFSTERQLLASLRHRGIARILDGGVTEDDLPYLVMELVDGVPLDRYCAERQPTLEDRLRLFIAICDVVQFAHQSLVVHRDLKPSNILVDADGAVTLLDFGIAKLLDAPEAVTIAAQAAPFTPGFASPEQIEGRPVSTATDVYALGTILYQLLVGHGPHAADTPTLPELARRIAHEDPLPPSRAAASAGVEGSRPPWTERLRGDLDAITLKALARRVEDRYASAQSLADDLMRHLSHEPVRARRGARGYAARRFVRRHRLGLGASVAVVAALTAGLAGAVSQARVARAEAARAERVSSMVLSLFQFTDPLGSVESDELRPEDLLDRGLQVAEREFADDRPTRARMYRWIGEGYGRVGAQAKARSLLEAALADARDIGDADAEAHTLHALAILAEAQGRFEDGRVFLTEELRILDSLGSMDDARRAAALSSLSGVVVRESPDSALVLLSAARELYVDDGGIDDERVLTVDGRRAGVLASRGDLEAAEALYEDVIARWYGLHPAGHPDVSAPLNDLAVTRRRAGDLQGAEEAYRRSLVILDQYGGPAHPYTRRVRSNLAGILGQTGREDDALTTLGANVEALRSEHPDRTVEIARAVETVGSASLVYGRPAGAASQYRLAIESFEDADPPARLMAALARIKLSVALHALGDSAEADRVWAEGERYLFRPDGGSLNSAGRGTLQWLAGQADRLELPDLAARVRDVLVRLDEYEPSAARTPDR